MHPLRKNHEYVLIFVEKMKLFGQIIKGIKMENRCPECGSRQIDYDALEIHDNQVCYPCTCKACGQNFKMWYRLIYEETTKD